MQSRHRGRYRDDRHSHWSVTRILYLDVLSRRGFDILSLSLSATECLTPCLPCHHLCQAILNYTYSSLLLKLHSCICSCLGEIIPPISPTIIFSLFSCNSSLSPFSQILLNTLVYIGIRLTITLDYLRQAIDKLHKQ